MQTLNIVPHHVLAQRPAHADDPVVPRAEVEDVAAVHWVARTLIDRVGVVRERVVANRGTSRARQVQAPTGAARDRVTFHRGRAAQIDRGTQTAEGVILNRRRRSQHARATVADRVAVNPRCLERLGVNGPTIRILDHAVSNLQCSQPRPHYSHHVRVIGVVEVPQPSIPNHRVMQHIGGVRILYRAPVGPAGRTGRAVAIAVPAIGVVPAAREHDFLTGAALEIQRPVHVQHTTKSAAARTVHRLELHHHARLDRQRPTRRNRQVGSDQVHITRRPDLVGR